MSEERDWPALRAFTDFGGPCPSPSESCGLLWAGLVEWLGRWPARNAMIFSSVLVTKLAGVFPRFPRFPRVPSCPLVTKLRLVTPLALPCPAEQESDLGPTYTLPMCRKRRQAGAWQRGKRHDFFIVPRHQAPRYVPRFLVSPRYQAPLGNASCATMSSRTGAWPRTDIHTSDVSEALPSGSLATRTNEETKIPRAGDALNDVYSANGTPPPHFLRANGPIIPPAQSKGDRKVSGGLGHHPPQHKKACKADHSDPGRLFIDRDATLTATRSINLRIAFPLLPSSAW